MGSLAAISGVALVPGVSRNRRLYTPELIAKAAKRMQDRIADPNGLPIVMRTHHDAGDDSAKIVGRVTSVEVDANKALRYKADLYNTFHGQQIAGLVTPEQPALRSVSIHGYWMGDPKQVQTDEGLATTADDLEIDAIDFTASPGVDGALIDAGGKPVETNGVVRTAISESMEAQLVRLEEGTAHITAWSTQRGEQYEGPRLLAVAAKYGWTATEASQVPRWLLVWEAKYSADDMKTLLAKGHAMKNAAGEPSYPIADVSDLRKAIHAVGRGKASHDAVRRHIMKRAKALGQSGLIPGNWNSDGSMKESAIRLSEIREYYPEGPGGTAGFCIDAYAGPLSVTVRGCVPPDQLRTAAHMATGAAMDAINCMDPDADADIDVDGAEDMDEQGTAAVGGDIPDDDMKDKYSESAQGDAVDDVEANITSPVADEMTMHPDDHAHTHELNGDGHTHAHSHIHESEGDGPQYSHSHTHTHVHASTDGPAHDHGHNHVHMTSSSATAETTEETNTMEETAMGDTQETAAEAAPVRTLTEADLTALGTTISTSMAEALKAFADMTAPKDAAAPQETTEQATEPVAESTPVVATPKAEDLTALKESLAKELRKEIRDELRAELLEEKGLPPRRGYRLNENAEEEVQLTDKELFDRHRTELLLGAYGLSSPVIAPAPAADAPAA